MCLRILLVTLGFSLIFQCVKGALIKRDIAIPGQFPYTVGIHVLQDDSRHVGAVVTEFAVLTAAIPLYVDPLKANHSALLYFGAYRWGDLNETGRISISARIGDIITHPEYNPRYATDALAFIKLPMKLGTSESIQLIALPSNPDKEKSFDDYAVQIPTWGKYYMNNKYPKVMNYVNSSVLPYHVCQKQKKVYRGRFCLRGVFGTALCSGDEGAPVVVISGNRPLLIGVVAKTTCKPNDPTLATRLTRYLDWIEPTLEQISNEHLEERKRLDTSPPFPGVKDLAMMDEYMWRYYTSAPPTSFDLVADTKEEEC